jgi:small subunit ribosomal protein S9
MAEEIQKLVKSKKSKNKEYISATGKRKEAVARVRLYQFVKENLVWNSLSVKKGDIFVNQKPVKEYFPSIIEQYLYTEPLRITNAHQNNHAFTIKVTGGGTKSQLDAVVAGISNALQKLDPEKYRPILKKKGFLTRDARIRERRMIGTGGKSRRQKQSPKR